MGTNGVGFAGPGSASRGFHLLPNWISGGIRARSARDDFSCPSHNSQMELGWENNSKRLIPHPQAPGEELRPGTGSAGNPKTGGSSLILAGLSSSELREGGRGFPRDRPRTCGSSREQTMAKVASKLSLSQSPTAWMQPRTWMVPSSSRRCGGAERGSEIPGVLPGTGLPKGFCQGQPRVGVFWPQKQISGRGDFCSHTSKGSLGAEVQVLSGLNPNFWGPEWDLGETLDHQIPSAGASPSWEFPHFCTWGIPEQISPKLSSA